MRAVLFHESKELRELLAFIMEARLFELVHEINSPEDAFKFTQNAQPLPEVFVCDDSPAALKTAKSMLSAQDKLFVLVVGLGIPKDQIFDAKKDQVYLIHNQRFFTDIETVAVRFQKEVSARRENLLQGYTRIKTQLLLKTNPTLSGIYLKVSPTREVKVLKKGDKFETKEFDVYTTQKNIGYLHIKGHDISTYLDVFKPQLTERLARLKPHAQTQTQPQPQPQTQTKSQSQAKPPAPKAPAQPAAVEGKKSEFLKSVEKDLTQVLDGVMEIGKRLGFTEEVQAMAKKNVMDAIAGIRRSPKLSVLIGELRREKEKYIPTHSMLLAYVSCAIAGKLQTRSDRVYEKFALASFLHDITLRNHDLALVDSLKELDQRKDQFTPAEYDQFKLHTYRASELAKTIREIPLDVDQNIAQHHERPDGSGFPRGLVQPRIHPLATVLIVAHDIVDFLYATPVSEMNQLKVEQIRDLHPATYKFPSFSEVLSLVKSLQL